MRASRRAWVAALWRAPLVAGAEPAMSYLHTYGPAGDPATRLGWGLGIVSIVVVLVITILLLGAVLRRRARDADPEVLAVDRDEGGMPWLYIGVGVSTVVLIACAVWTMFTIAAVAMPAQHRPDAAGHGGAVVVERALRKQRDPVASSRPPTRSTFRSAGRFASR